MASQVALLVKNPSVSAGDIGMGVWSLRSEDPLEKEMATHSSVLAWKIPWTEEPDWLQFMGSQRVGHNWGAEHVAQEVASVVIILQLGELLKVSQLSVLEVRSELA